MKTLTLQEIKEKAKEQNLQLQKAKDWLNVVEQLTPERFFKKTTNK